MSEPPGQSRIEFEPHADAALEAGNYANGLAIWHTLHEFTFDFFVSSQPPSEARTPDGEVVIRAKLLGLPCHRMPGGPAGHA